MEKTLEYDLGKNKSTVLKVVFAAFLGIISFLTFSYFAFSDKIPKNLRQENLPTQQLLMKENRVTPSFSVYTHPLYKFSLQYPSNLQAKVQINTSSLAKVTIISFGEYSGKSTPQDDPPFISHYSLVVTDRVAPTTSIEVFSKLSNNNPKWSEAIIGGIVGKRVSYTCGNRNCNVFYIKKGTEIYRLSSSEPQYDLELVTIFKSFQFIN